MRPYSSDRPPSNSHLHGGLIVVFQTPSMTASRNIEEALRYCEAIFGIVRIRDHHHENALSGKEERDLGNDERGFQANILTRRVYVFLGLIRHAQTSSVKIGLLINLNQPQKLADEVDANSRQEEKEHACHLQLLR